MVTASDTLLRPLQELLNRQISRSTAAQDAAAVLDGRLLAIRLRNTALTLYLAVCDGALRLHRDTDKDPDALLETTPLGLAELARGDASGGRIAMTGDPVVAQRFEQLLRQTHPDWEEELSRLLGDVAAHQVGNAVRGLLAFGERAFSNFGRDTAEFLQEEHRDVPAPAEIEQFCRSVSDVDRQVQDLGAQLEQLLQKVER